MMRWWLDRGVDGFRMDVINFISKRIVPGTPGLLDSPAAVDRVRRPFAAHPQRAADP